MKPDMPPDGNSTIPSRSSIPAIINAMRVGIEKPHREVRTMALFWIFRPPSLRVSGISASSAPRWEVDYQKHQWPPRQGCACLEGA